jgi:hypothetical protein
MPHRRIITLILAGILAGASAVPAFADSEDKPIGLDRARQATMQAIELAADDVEEAPPAVPPGQAKDKPGKDTPDRGNANKGNPHIGENKKLMGRARAAAAIASALAREDGNGNAFGRGHAREVIQLLLADKTPEALETDESHGAAVSAMVRAYNELKAKERRGLMLPEGG